MCDLKGKIALVSGAGQGIGARTAEMLAEAGAVVVVTDVNDATGEATVARIRAAGHQAHFQHLDVTREDDWKSVMSDVCAKSGGLDVLVNNAGVELIKPLAELTLEDWHWICRINLDGVFLGTKYGIRAMTDGSTSRPKGGSIINLSSVAGLVAGALQSAYCLLHDQGRGAAVHEVGGRGVRPAEDWRTREPGASRRHPYTDVGRCGERRDGVEGRKERRGDPRVGAVQAPDRTAGRGG